MALPIGRGMFTLATDTGLKSVLSERLFIPPLVLTGKSKESNVSINLDPSILPSDLVHFLFKFQLSIMNLVLM
jgi:hypothetical protein